MQMGIEMLMKRVKKNLGLIYPILMILIYPFIMGKKIYSSRFASFVWSSQSLTATDYFLIFKMYFFLFATLIFLVYAWISTKKKKEKYNIAGFVGLFSYQVLSVISFLFSSNKYLSVLGANEQFEPIWVLLSYGVCAYLTFLFIKEEEERIWVYRAATVAVCIMGIIGIIQYVMIHTKVYLTLYNSNYVGMMLATLLPILYMRMMDYEKPQWESWLYRAAVLFGIITLILSGSKSAIMISIWGFLLFLLMQKAKKWVCFLYLVLTLLSGLGLLGYKAFGGETGTSRIGNVITEKNKVTFLENCGNVISFQFDMLNNDNYLFTLMDSDGKEISYGKNGEETRYVPNDERFSDFLFTIVEYENYFGFMVTVDGRDWYFARNASGEYCYVNGYGNLDSFQVAKSWLFDGEEGFATNRGYIWSRTLPLLFRYLFVGSGPDTFASVFPQNDVGKYLTTDIPYKMIITKPHNMYLQIAIQTGVFSLIALLFYIGSVLKGLRKTNQNGLYIAILCYLLVAVFNDSSLCVAPVFFVITGMRVD